MAPKSHRSSIFRWRNGKMVEEPEPEFTEFELPPLPTPRVVVDAIQRIATHLRETGKVECIISPNGGASFEIESTWDKARKLYDHVDEQERLLFIAGQDWWRHKTNEDRRAWLEATGLPDPTVADAYASYLRSGLASPNQKAKVNDE
jgi:hypothetical protein